MSRGRRIEEVERLPSRLLQALRLVGLVLCIAADVGVARRFGLPSPLAWVNAGLAGVTAVGLLLGASWAFRRWPRARVFAPLRRAERRLDPNRRLEFTREGRILVGITVAVGVAAVNTGNNFLYLVLGLLLALVTVSGVLSEAGLRAVTVHLEPGGERYSGQPGTLAFHVRNGKGWMTSMALEVGPLLALPGLAAPVVAWPGRLVLRLSPGGQERVVMRGMLPRRGEYRLLGFEVATAYPFGFFRKAKHEIPEDGEPATLLCWPAPAPVRRESVRVRALLGERLGGRAGRGDEFFSLRPWREGEDPRRVAWKRSARTGRLQLREDEEPASRTLTLVLATGLAAPDAAARERFEAAVSLAAGLALELLDQGDAVGLVAGAAVVAPRAGAGARPGLLEALARVEVSDGLPALPPGTAWGAIVAIEGPGKLPPLPRVDLHLGAAAAGRAA